MTTIVVLHDLNLAAHYCDRLLLLHGGEIAASGPPEEVLTRELLGPIYGARIRRLVEPDCRQLLVSPAEDEPAYPPPAARPTDAVVESPDLRHDNRHRGDGVAANPSLSPH